MSGKTKIVSGMRIGKLTINYASGRSNDGHQLWACKCDCGSIVMRPSNNLSAALKNGRASSCGCTLPKPMLTHGRHRSPEYMTWISMKDRCFNKAQKNYSVYSVLGMDERWRDDFLSFFSHIGPRPSAEMQIDRIDNTIGYFPGNVRWATVAQQARNKSTTYDWYIGEKKYETCVDAASDYGLDMSTVYSWFVGKMDYRTNSFRPPRLECKRVRRYE